MPTAATIARRTAQRKRANQIKKQKESSGTLQEIDYV